MKASNLSFRVAVVLALAGMVWGIQMGISNNHSALSAHAHLNLLGWVSLFIFGVFYNLHPALDRSRLALAQVWVWIAAVLIMSVGVGLVDTGHDVGEPLAIVSSLMVLGDMLLFAWFIFTREQKPA